MSKLLKEEYGFIFEEPVDPEKLNLPDYREVIKNPMDLGTVKKQLESAKHYFEIERFAADVKLTFDNALKYNPPGQDIHKIAKDMKDLFLKVKRGAAFVFVLSVCFLFFRDTCLDA